MIVQFIWPRMYRYHCFEKAEYGENGAYSLGPAYLFSPIVQESIMTTPNTQQHRRRRSAHH